MDEQQHADLRRDELEDLIARLDRADLRLTRMAEQALELGAKASYQRLYGKASGVRLARSYVRELLP